MKQYNPKIKIFFLGLFVLPLFLAVLFSLLKLFSPAILKFPNVIEIYSDFFISLSDNSVLKAILSTARLILISSFVSVILGILFSFLLNLNKWIWSIFEPTLDFLRSIPVTFFIPAFAIILGISSPNIIWILAVIPSSLIIIVNVLHGIKQQNLNRLHQYYLISGKKSKISAFIKVTFFEVLPYFIAGFKISLSYAIVIVTVLEYMQMGNETGLGTLVYNEMEQLNYKRVYSIIIIVGLIGYILNQLIDKISQKYGKF
jgi:ABC-type nitrate/sulfonate/bicarbonate transport system permease component